MSLNPSAIASSIYRSPNQCFEVRKPTGHAVSASFERVLDQGICSHLKRLTFKKSKQTPSKPTLPFVPWLWHKPIAFVWQRGSIPRLNILTVICEWRWPFILDMEAKSRKFMSRNTNSMKEPTFKHGRKQLNTLTIINNFTRQSWSWITLLFEPVSGKNSTNLSSCHQPSPFSTDCFPIFVTCPYLNSEYKPSRTGVHGPIRSQHSDQVLNLKAKAKAFVQYQAIVLKDWILF